MKQPTLNEMRSAAIGAARAYLREMGVALATVDASGAWDALGDVSRREPQTLAAQWVDEAYRRYLIGQRNQIQLFNREWRRFGRHQGA